MLGMFSTSCQKSKGSLLYDSIGEGNLEAVKETVDAGADINLMGTLLLPNENPLKIAMENSQLPIVEYLLQKGANPDFVDNDGISLLMYTAGAQKKGINKVNIIRVDYCKLLLKYKADINKTGGIGYTALDYAIRDYSSDQTIRLLLENGAKIRPITLQIALNSYNESYCETWVVKHVLESLKKEGAEYEIDSALEAAILGDSPKTTQLIKENKIRKEFEQQILFYTAAYDNVQTLQLLLEKGLDIKSVDYKGNTLLMLAAQCGNIDNVKYLLKQGLNIEAKNYSEKTSLIKSVIYNQYDTTEYLLESGAISNINDGDYQDALCYAASNGNIEMIKLLVDNGYPLNDKSIYNAIFAAAKNNQITVLQYFLDSGTTFNIEFDDFTLLDNVIIFSELDTIKYMVEHGVSVNGITIKGKPLSTAATFGLTDIADFLISKGADVNGISKYNDGSIATAPLTNAILSGSFDIVKLLVEHGADINYKDVGGGGDSALQIAERHMSNRIKEYIKTKTTGQQSK